MTTLRSSARYKRCPKCRAMLRAVAEFCPHCGLSMPVSFPHGPLVSRETARVLRKLNEEVVPRHQTRAPITGRYLVLVAPDRKDLFEYFSKKFAAEVGVEVRYERRVGERRRRPAITPLDRRRQDRRAKPPLEDELRRFGFAIVNLK